MHYEDVKKFHQKFDLDTDETVRHPQFPDLETLDYRFAFMEEELLEFGDAVEENNLNAAADALLDLVYVAYGTALMMGISPACWNEMWAEVQRANMSKERATGCDDVRSKRRNSLDVVKPDGWTPPDGERILKKHGAKIEA